MTQHACLILRSPGDPRDRSLLEDARALGLTALTGVEVEDLYFLQGDAGQGFVELLCDPVAQQARWRSSQEPGPAVELALRPGVTDPVAEQLLRAAGLRGLSLDAAATGLRFLLKGDLSSGDIERFAGLVANPVIHTWAVGAVEPHFLQAAGPNVAVEVVPVRGASPQELVALAKERRTALDEAEMLAVQAYFREEDRDPTDAELEMIAQTWSEHCVHKTFKALIELEDGTTVDGLLKTYLKAATDRIAAPWVLSAFVDNAGILAFDDHHEVSFKVETHNHPSAIEPFGGANTGVGGVIRDVLGVSARPIAATDVLCFGPPDHVPPANVIPPRLVRSGVVAGIADYGNKIGIPTVSGAIVYHEGYTANPLVYCGCVGIAPRGSHPRNAKPGDRIVVLGGRTGRDGIRGATFSSMTMEAETGQVAGASVQIGNPIVEKGLIDVLMRARDEGLYTAITDCGAGGLSSAVGEMAAELGARVDLQAVPLKYAGLAPWEVWLSEAQERMVCAVPAGNVARLQELCDLYQVELSSPGEFTNSGRVVVTHGDTLVVHLDCSFLHEGIPRRHMRAVRREPRVYTGAPVVPGTNEEVIRRFDHEVLGQTVVRPLVGPHQDAPSDAVVLKPLGTEGQQGIVLSCGLNPWLGEADPYVMALWAVDEAVRNAVCVGADPARMAILDNFCWGDPRRPETLGDLVEACRGCHDAAVLYGTPFVSGKDSLNNEYVGSDGQRHAIPPTLLISALALIPDVTKAVTMELKRAGSRLYLLGTPQGAPFARELPEWAPRLYRMVHQLMREGALLACHDASEGGLAVALAEMAQGGRLSVNVTLTDPDSERPCRLIVETPHELALEVPCEFLGEVTA